MKRFHLIEIHEQNWCPAFIRDAVTDYLQKAISVGDVYQPIFHRLTDAVQTISAEQIVDLCSGGGGPWLNFKKKLSEVSPSTEVILTDFHPNLEAFQRLKSESNIGFSSEPINAVDVPVNLKGFRTMFSSFHHFQPIDAKEILRDAVAKNCGIGIFEATPRLLKALILMLLSPLFVFFLTPLIKPFRWSRIIFTYLIPVIPFIVGFDGVVSVLRTYTPAELLEMAKSIDEEKFQWEAGEEKSEKSPLPVVFLIGRPK